MRYVWVPRLLERIQAQSDSNSSGQPTSSTTTCTDNSTTTNHADLATSQVTDPSFMPDISGAQVSPESDLTDSYNLHSGSNYSQNGSDNVCESWDWSKPGSDMQGLEQQLQNNNWLGGGDSLESLWNEENIWFLQQQLHDDKV